MSSQYPVLNNKPIDQWKVTELKEELRRRKIPVRGLKEELVRKLFDAIRNEEMIKEQEVDNQEQEVDNQVQADHLVSDHNDNGDQMQAENSAVDCTNTVVDPIRKTHCDATATEIDVNNTVNILDAIGKTDCNATTTDVDGNNSVVISDPIGKTDCDATMTDIDVNQDITVQDAMTATSGLDETVLETKANVVSLENSATDIDVNQEITIQDAITATSGLDGTGLETKANVDSLEDSATKSQTVITQCESSVLVKRSEEKHDDSATESQTVITQSESSVLVTRSEEKHEEPNVPPEDIKHSLSESENQVSVVSPDLGSQVKCESIPIDSVSIIEKNKLKDNLNADDFHLEQEVVKPEMVQPSSCSVPPLGGDQQPLVDEKEQVEHHVSLEDTNVKKSTNFDISKKEDHMDEGSPEKLNLDRSSSDELMEEDVSESKHIESNIKSEELAGKTEVKEEPSIGEKTKFDGSLGKSIPDVKDTVDEDPKKPTVPTEKRKLEDQEAVASKEAPKRQRRWNTETVKIPERQTSNISTSSTPKDAFQPTPRRTLAKSDSKPSGDSQKERIVPPSQKPVTTSLRIDKFLRPFTLKAVQELLAKTGTVCSFWMDHIKTHCYVTYSSVEEANATRNALYNLQWPPNGGNLLVAEFVDPQEVKARADAPPQSPAPISPSPTTTKSTNFQQTQAAQPSPRQHPLRPQQPHLPTPPTLSDPPAARERFPLPPPPPRELEPPALTLDDLFRKTKATPRIYYLPLSEEEVASKLPAQGKRH